MRTEDEIVCARLNCEVADRHRREAVTLELGPGLAAIDRDPESKFSSEKEQISFRQVFLDNMRVSANAFGFLRSDERRPSAAVVACFEDVGREIAKSVT